MTKIQTSSPRQKSPMISLFRLGQSLADTPYREVTREEAEQLVKVGEANWRSNSKAVQLAKPVQPKLRPRDLSAMMPGSVTERAAAGNYRAQQLAAAWQPIRKGREMDLLEKLLDCEGAADVLGYTPKRVRELADAGALPCVRLPRTRELRFRPSSLARLIESSERQVITAAA